MSPTGPASTMRPSFSTMAVCAMLRTSARLCVMKIIARWRSRCSWRSNSTITACTETSRAEVTASQTSRSGSTTRARDPLPPRALGDRDAARVSRSVNVKRQCGGGCMRAALCTEFGAPLVIEDVELRQPGPGEVSVRVVACAVCHTDVAYARGAWGGVLPAVYGHEAAGVVDGVGPGGRAVGPGG